MAQIQIKCVEIWSASGEHSLKEFFSTSVNIDGFFFSFFLKFFIRPEKAEILIKVDHEKPSWWVLVCEEIGNESDMVITEEEHVVDGMATFMARCILANPKEQWYMT